MNRRETVFFLIGIALTALVLTIVLGQSTGTASAFQVSPQPSSTPTFTPVPPTPTFTPVAPTPTFTPVPPTPTFTPLPPTPTPTPVLPPLVNVDQPLVTVDEGQMAANSGTVVDPDGTVVSLAALPGERQHFVGHFLETFFGQVQLCQLVLMVGVETGGDQDEVGIKLAGHGQEVLVKEGQVLLVIGTGLQRQVEGKATAGPQADFFG